MDQEDYYYFDNVFNKNYENDTIYNDSISKFPIHFYNLNTIRKNLNYFKNSKLIKVKILEFSKSSYGEYLYASNNGSFKIPTINANRFQIIDNKFKIKF